MIYPNLIAEHQAFLVPGSDGQRRRCDAGTDGRSVRGEGAANG